MTDEESRANADGGSSPVQQTNTGGGAYISGDVESGGDVVGRDQIRQAETVNIYTNAPAADETGEPAPASVQTSDGHNWAKIGLIGGGAAMVLAVSLFFVLRVFSPPQTAEPPESTLVPSPTVQADAAAPVAATATPAPLCADDARQCVLVAAFDPPEDAQAAEISDRVLAELASDDLLPVDTFNVQSVDAINSGEQVRNLAAEEQPQIIVWGQIFEGFEELIVHFELSNQLGVDQSNQLRPYRVQFFESVAPQLVCAGNCFASADLRQAINQLGEVVAHMAAGMLHYGLGQAEEADHDFGIALHCIGEPVDATDLNLTNVDCSQNLALDSFNTGSLFYYAGRAKLLTGDYASALDYLQEAADQHSDDPAPLMGIASVYRSWIDAEEIPMADEALEQATERANALRTAMVNRDAPDQKVAAVDYELGFIAELQEDWGSAEEKYARAIQGFGPENPESYVAQIARGRALRKAEEIEAADETLQAAHALDPTVPWALLELAQLQHGDRPTAESYLQEARDIAPSQPYVDIVTAQLCAEWGEIACAEEAFQRAQEKRPNSGWLQGLIGDFYRPGAEPLPHQDWSLAAKHYAKAAQRRPKDPWVHERLAFAQFYNGEVAEAADHFAVSLHDLSHPQSQLPERYCTLAQAQQAASKYDEALGNYQLCLEKLDDPEMQETVKTLIAQVEELAGSAAD